MFYNVTYRIEIKNSFVRSLILFLKQCFFLNTSVFKKTTKVVYIRVYRVHLLSTKTLTLATSITPAPCPYRVRLRICDVAIAPSA